MEDINRREAIKKMGKYAAFTALGTMIILDPLKAQSCSSPPCGGGPNGDGPPGHGGTRPGNNGGGGFRVRGKRRSIFK